MSITGILYDADGDLLIKNGSFAHGDTTRQHQRDLMLATPGMYSQFLEAGVGLANYILDDVDSSDLEAAINEDFERDGMTIYRLKITGAYDMDIKSEYR